MKRGIKYVIALFLFIIAFLAIGERFVYHLAHFEDTYFGMTFEYSSYGQVGSNTLAKDEIANALEKNKFDVFRVDTRYTSDYKEVKTVYGTQGALADLRQHGIIPQTYHSMFIGEVEVVFKDFSEIEDIYESDVFYFIGTIEQAASFKNISAHDLNGYYRVKDLKSVSGSETGVYATLILVWGSVFLMIILLTLYHVILSKKETTVRLTLGDNPYHEFALNTCIDSFVFSALFFGLSLILETFSHVQYKFGYACIMFAFMIVINAVVNFLVTRVSLKKDFSNALGSKGTLIATYIMKSICLVMAIVILSANSIIIAEAINYFKQEKFFADRGDYNYYKFNYSTASESRLGLKYDDEKDALKELWREIETLSGSDSLHLFDLSDSYEQSVVLLNTNAMNSMLPYISRDLELKLLASKDEKLYVYFPQNYDHKNVSRVIEMTSAIFLHNVEGEVNNAIVTGTYKGNSSVIGINSGRNIYRSVFLNNPIVIFDNMKPSFMTRYLNPLYMSSDFLYNIPPAELNQLMLKYHMEKELVSVTNARELYQYNHAGIERNIKLMSAVSLFILVLETLMIMFTVRLEYTVNGVEIAIRKTLGYGLLGQNKRLVMLPCILIPICTAGAVIAVHLLDYGNPLYALISGVVILCAEMAFVVSQCLRVDRIKTAKILKGAKI